MKINKKILTYIFFILFFSILSIFYFKEYFDFYKEKTSINEKIKLIEKHNIDFDINRLNKIENINLYYTPYKELLNSIVDRIEKAKSYIYIEVYMFSEKRIKNALIKAKERGLDIKIVLEKNPYNAYNINNKHYNELKKNNIEVVWSQIDKFNFNHAKFLIIDDELILSTWNLTYSSFTSNRDLFLFIQDNKYIEIFKEIFFWDFNYKEINKYDNNLVLSPISARAKIKKLFLSANEEIIMYFQYFDDEELENILIEKAKKWIKISAIISKDSYEKDKEKIKYLTNNKINISYLKKIKQHAKMILVDKKYIFIWSINFSKNSLDNNRETWLIFENKEISSKLLELFKNDLEK